MLKTLQDALPKLWTLELYSKEFKADSSKHRDFQHALLHVTKAVGRLATFVEEADHSEFGATTEEIKKYLADIVICSLRMACTNPGGKVDLEMAVLDRIAEKMGVRLDVKRV